MYHGKQYFLQMHRIKIIGHHARLEENHLFI